jgi:uncharacterized protein YcgI (DUF1989 family)
MAQVEEVAMLPNTGRSFVLRKGERIRIHAESIVDLVAFNLDNLRERFDQARTKANQAKIFLSTGDVLYSKFNNVMMTIAHDTFRGKHDLQYGFCSYTRIASSGVPGRPSCEVFWERSKREPFFASLMQTAGIGKREDMPDHGCWENFIEALKAYDIAPEDIPSPFNLLESIEIGPSGEMIWRVDRDRPTSGQPAVVELRAEMNCLVALSLCPEITIGRGARVEIHRD